MAGESIRDGRLVEMLAELACEGPTIHKLTFWWPTPPAFA